MGPRCRTAALIAGLFLMMAPNLWAGKIDLRQINNYLLEFRSGSGANAWHIQYGTQFRPSPVKILEGPGSTAYFSHYDWLRRIDTDKGIVTGRWRFPGQLITDLRWENDIVQVEVSVGVVLNSRVLATYPFDPAAPQFPGANQMTSDASRAEALASFSRALIIQGAEAAAMLPELENAVRRDPFSPWLRIGLGRIYSALGNPKSAQLVREGIELESAHFSELLDIANYLVERDPEASRMAFERGYAEFWHQGQDPRLVSLLLVSRSNSRVVIPEPVQREQMNRIFAVSPWVDGAANAWEIYGKWLIGKGDETEGALWLERAKEARDNGLLFSGDDRHYDSLSASLVRTTFLAGSVFYVLVLFFRYQPQRRARREAEQAARTSRPGFCNVEYWRRSERLAFLFLIAIAWMADGYASASVRASSSRSFKYFYEMSAGSMFTSGSIDTLKAGPQNPERDFLLAIAYQRDGLYDKAETLYRSFPQFAESWNNLGVLLKNSGRSEEGRHAFERALELRPNFPEAEWNLGKPARGEWVKAHERYVPGKAMMTVPSRVQVMRAYGIKDTSADWASILKGPLDSSDRDNRSRPRGRLRSGLLIFLAAGAVALVFIRPREVLLAPPKYQWGLELLFPGTARAWSILAGIVLGLAVFCSSSLWPPAWARLYSYFSNASAFRRFPLPTGALRAGPQEISSPIPSFWWLVALFTVNGAVVLFWKWRRK